MGILQVNPAASIIIPICAVMSSTEKTLPFPGGQCILWDESECGIEPLDSVYLDREVRSRLEYRLVECAVIYGFFGISSEIAIRIECECMRELLAADCECAGVEYLQRSISDCCLNLCHLLCCSRCCVLR